MNVSMTLHCPHCGQQQYQTVFGPVHVRPNLTCIAQNKRVVDNHVPQREKNPKMPLFRAPFEEVSS
jgi:hypothetical protein